MRIVGGMAGLVLLVGCAAEAPSTPPEAVGASRAAIAVARVGDAIYAGMWNAPVPALGDMTTEYAIVARRIECDGITSADGLTKVHDVCPVLEDGDAILLDAGTVLRRGPGESVPTVLVASQGDEMVVLTLRTSGTY